MNKIRQKKLKITEKKKRNAFKRKVETRIATAIENSTVRHKIINKYRVTHAFDIQHYMYISLNKILSVYLPTLNFLNYRMLFMDILTL